MAFNELLRWYDNSSEFTITDGVARFGNFSDFSPLHVYHSTVIMILIRNVSPYPSRLLDNEQENNGICQH